MHITLTRRRQMQMPARIKTLNAGPARLLLDLVAQAFEAIPAPTLRRVVIAADLLIVALVVAGVMGFLS